MCVQPKSSHSFETDQLTSVFYTLIIPMLTEPFEILFEKQTGKRCPAQDMEQCVQTLSIKFILAFIYEKSELTQLLTIQTILQMNYGKIE